MEAGLPMAGMNVQAIFRDRMRREGHGEEYDALVQRYIDAEEKVNGKPKFGSYGRAMWKAMKDLGYTNPGEERRKYEGFTAQQDSAEELARVHETANGILAALNAIPDLPGCAAPGLELEWVGGHPAILRYDLQSDQTKKVMITADDILHAPNGLPPSRRAVSQLVHWANRVGEFHKQLLLTNKKAVFVGDEGQAAEDEHDIGLKEVRDLLAGLAVKKK